MESIMELMQEISLHNFDVGSSSWVDVTHINNPHSFYVRPTSYRKYLPTIQTHDQKVPMLELKLQMDVIYKSKILRCYCRGHIFYINKSDDKLTCDIFAIDYGFLEKSISMKRIYQNHHKPNMPPLATHCLLADCEPKDSSWTDKETEAMKCYVGQERAKLIVRGKIYDKLIVELINTCPDNIATMLALTGYSTFGYNDNLISRIPTLKPEKHYYTFQKLNRGDILHVRMQSGKELNEFYVAQVDNYNEYIKERKNLTAFSMQKCALRPEDMKENKPISVYVSQIGRYERGIIRTIIVSEEKALVQLVDWGSVIQADVSQMKPISECYFSKSVISLYCSAEKRQLLDNRLQKFLYPGYEFLITIKEVGKQFDSPNIVHLSSLTKK